MINGVIAILFLTSLVGFSGTAVGQTPGLVAAYSFDEGVGTIVENTAGISLSGMITGATWTNAGRFGNALSFDGVNDWVTVGDAAALDLTIGMTLEAWVRPTAVSDWRSVVLKERAGGLAYSIYAYDNTLRPAAFINTGGVDAAVFTGTNLPLNIWTHVAATYNGASLRIYTNGARWGANSLKALSWLPLFRSGSAEMRCGASSLQG